MTLSLVRTVEIEHCFIITPRMSLQECGSKLQETPWLFFKLSIPMLQELEQLRRKTCKSLESLEISDPAQRVDMFDLVRAKSSEPLMRNRLGSSISNKIANLWHYHAVSI